MTGRAETTQRLHLAPTCGDATRRRLCVRGMFGALLLVGAVLSGCGPVTAVSTIQKANEAIDEAEKAGAERYAPYEHTRAQSFLHKSREMQGFGLYEQSMIWARESRIASEKAIDVARIAREREARLKKFSRKPSKKGEDGGFPGFTPSGEGE